jgi:hypothetical protein
MLWNHHFFLGLFVADNIITFIMTHTKQQKKKSNKGPKLPKSRHCSLCFRNLSHLSSSDSRDQILCFDCRFFSFAILALSG